MILQLLDGRKLDIEDYSLKWLSHHIPSVGITHNIAEVEGRSGNVLLDSRFTDRVIQVELLYIATDLYDYYLIRDEVNALFSKQESFYIIFKKEPYKRYKVRLNSSFEVAPNQQMESFVVEFICDNIFGESIGTTIEMAANKVWDKDLFAWNNHIAWDDDLAYTFNTNNFTVKNLGNVVIDPCQHELEITLKGTFNRDIFINNLTTGDTYHYKQPLTTSDTLVLRGIQSFKNGTSVFKDTNKKLIKIATGDNKFVITGSGTTAKISSISFNFRFLYL